MKSGAAGRPLGAGAGDCLAGAGNAYDDLTFAGREVHRLFPVRAPLPRVNHPWRDQFQGAEEAGEAGELAGRAGDEPAYWLFRRAMIAVPP